MAAVINNFLFRYHLVSSIMHYVQQYNDGREPISASNY